jgi:ABC-type uncharacterized transport system involved in gliding motility auxiliary subunit
MAASKRSETLLYSAVGVLAVFIGLIALNFVLSFVKVRLDLTEEKAYTLSEGTRQILARLDTPVTIRFYYSASDPMMPVPLKTYAQRVEDLLREYRQISGGKLRLEKYDPQPDSDAEDSAKLDGIEGQMIQTGDEVYLGVSVSCLDQKVAIPFLSPERERLLEYDLTRAISGVTKTTKPVLGLMAGLPMTGSPMTFMMMQQGRQGSPPWFIVSELKRDFTVREVPLTAEKIDDDIELLLVVHPKNLSERTQFALDQFVLRGGKLVAFLDPRSTVDSRNMGGPMGGFGQASSSTLGKLLDTWGVQFDTSKCVADLEYTTLLRGPQGRPQPSPVVLSLTANAVDRDDVVTAQVDSLLLWCAGAFTGTPAEGLKQTVLLKSSPNSQLVDSFTAEMSGEQIQREFKPSGREYPLAVRLTGKFKTAFPDGQPKAAPDAAADAADAAEKKPEEAPAEALKESKTDGAVILVGDADLLYDQFAVQIQEFFGQQIVIPRNANLTLAQSMVEQLAGDSALIAVRSRASLTRPFTLVKKIQAQAEENYRAKIKSLEESLQETQRRLSELQHNKEKGQRFILSPEQQAELENFRKKEAEVKRELKELRKNLRRDIDALENRLKWVNIAGMPILVTLSGIGLAMIKRKRTAAQ